MKKILNPWVGMEGYHCFGCSPNNPFGMQMEFYQDGEEIVSVWTPRKECESWIDTLHGGVQAVLLDEVCGWVIFKICNTSGVTAKMDIRYKHPVLTTNPYLVLKARIKEVKRQIVIVEGEIWDAQNCLCCSCECTYFTFNEQKALEMKFLHAKLAEEDLTLDEIISRKEKRFPTA